MSAGQPAAAPSLAPKPSFQAVLVLWLITVVIDLATGVILLWEPFGQDQAFGAAMLGGVFLVLSPPVIALVAFFSRPSFATGTILAVAVAGVPGTFLLVVAKQDWLVFDLAAFPVLVLVLIPLIAAIDRFLPG